MKRVIIMTKEESNLLVNDSLNDDISRPGCCLIVCILPWKPASIQKYLIGAYGKKSSDDSLKRKRMKENQLIENRAITNEERSSQKYYNTFKKQLPSVFTNRYDPLENFRSTPGILKDDDEFSNRDEIANIVYDFSSGTFKVNNASYFLTRDANFYDTTTGSKIWPFLIRNGSPVTLLNAAGAWMVCESESRTEFILCVKTSTNNALILASIREDNSLGIYTEEAIARSSVQRYIWRYKTMVFLGLRKNVISCIGSEDKNLFIFYDGLAERLVLSTEFEKALDWHMAD